MSQPKKSRLKIFLIATAAALPIAAIGFGVASAQTGPRGERGPGRMLFEMFDTNKDGKITRAEYNAARDKLFADMDYTKDGYLIGLEVRLFMRQRIEARMKARFAAIDTNKDGGISEAEWLASRDAQFKRMDSNKDGKVTEEEIRQSFARWAGSRAGRGRWGRHGHHGRGHEGRGHEGRGHDRWNRGDRTKGGEGRGYRRAQWRHHRHGRGGRGMGRMFWRADANRDGRVSKAEFTEFTDRMFGWLDKNNDGTITRSDLPTRAKRPGGRGR
jgi:hypothetical protein